MTTIDAAGGQRTVNEQSRPVMAALQISLDGYMQGANGEVDWVDGWNDGLDLLSDVDAAVIGAGTYPGYEQLWGSIAADPQSGTAMLGREPSAGEVEYARWTSERRTTSCPPRSMMSTGRQLTSFVTSASFGRSRTGREGQSTSSEAHRSCPTFWTWASSTSCTS